MKNKDIRSEMFEREISVKQLARAVGICDCTMSNWLRMDMTKERRARIRAGIDVIERLRA